MNVSGDFAASFVPLWMSDRGGHPDSVRLGAFAACRPDGSLVASAGDPDLRAFLRSSAKPFQCVALLRRGLVRPAGLSDVEVACACASHEGEDRHVEAARRILAAAGMEESALLCGTHPASGGMLLERVVRGEMAVSPIHNNCSGKHAAMLAVCRHESWPAATYPDADHPLQRENLAVVAAFAGVRPEDVTVAVDNCTVPTFALPLRATARAFARLLEPHGLPDELARAGEEASRAMRSRPEMVGGEGRFDTKLMELTRGRLVAKTGAGGFYAAAGTRPAEGDVVGFALKLSGAETEAQKAPVVTACLALCGLLTDSETETLLAAFDGPQKSCRGAIVGHSRLVADAAAPGDER